MTVAGDFKVEQIVRDALQHAADEINDLVKEK